ncbi:MAG: hypothetical protein NVSMB12_15800 [Acidimicrobiales bacterium]
MSLAVLVVALLAGCGGADPAPLRGDPDLVVRRAADRTMQVGGARVDISVASDLAGSGSVNLARGVGEFTFRRVGAQARVDDRFDVVAFGASEWVQASGPAGGMPGTTAAAPWLSGSPAALARTAGARVGPLTTVLVRPGLGTALAFLRGATKALRYGGEEVRGVNTFRYSFVVDLVAAAAASPPEQRPALEAAAAAIGPLRWPADVWLDAQGRVRRLQMAENPTLRSTTTKPNLLLTEDGNYLALTNITFVDLGAPVTVQPPAAAETVVVG